MLPKELMDPGLGNDLTYIYSAFEKRINQGWDRHGRTWDYHDGVPIFETLDLNRHGVWVKFDGIQFDEANAPFQSDFINSNWTVTLVYPDSGNDHQGFDQKMVLDVVGDMISLFRETRDDLSMDNVVDWATPPRVTNDVSVSQDGKRFGVIVFSLRMNHSLAYCRAEA